MLLKPALQFVYPKLAELLTLSSDIYISKLARPSPSCEERGKKIQALAEAWLSIFTNMPCVLHLGWELAEEFICPSQLRSIALLGAHNLILETNSTNLVLLLPHRMGIWGEWLRGTARQVAAEAECCRGRLQQCHTPAAYCALGDKKP